MHRVLVLAQGIEEIDVAGLGQRMPEGAHVRIRTALRPEAALRILDVWRADLLVTSDRSPEKSIAEFVANAKEKCFNLKVLLLQQSVGVENDSAATDAVLIDPFDRATFDDCVSELLGISTSSVGEFEAVATLTLPDASKQSALVMQLSPRGCRIESAEILTLGQDIQLRFFLPNIKTPVESNAVVRSKLDEDGMLWGLEFLDLPATTLAILEAYCRGNFG